jgi:outer membrane lipoprotein-sorting protein
MDKQFLRILMMATFLLLQSGGALFFKEGCLKTGGVEGQIDFLKNLNVALAAASQKTVTDREGGNKPMDGLTIMTMVSERDKGNDYTLSTSWSFAVKGREKYRSKYKEERKNYKGKDGFNYKSVIRYSAPPTIYRTSMLTWNHTDGKRTSWYFAPRFSEAQRTDNLERIRSQAEFDFSLAEYVDINLDEERHRFLRSETCNGKTCYVVESTPLKGDIKYGKRISWIDQENWIPQTIQYFDKSGALWKVLDISWQNTSGRWFWKKAVVENVQSDCKTFITIEDVKVNIGLNDREFAKTALEKKM